MLLGLDLFASTIDPRTTPAADTLCYWDAPASELGFSGGAAPAESAGAAPPAADPPSAGDAAATDSDDQGELATATADGADPVDDDATADPLDALSSDDDEADDPKTPVTPDQKMQRLKQRARKLERAYKKALPTVQALKEAGVDLRTLIARSQKLADFERSLDANPRLRSLVLGGEDDGSSARPDTRRAPAARQPEAAVEYPFDTKDDVGRFLADFHSSTNAKASALLERLERLETSLSPRVERIEQTARQREVSAQQATWRSATDAAATKLPTEYRAMFNDAVYGAMQQALTGQLRATPQQIIDHYLKQIRVSDGAKARASNAARQRIATRNDNLPRRPTGGAGTPASPRSRALPRLEAFNRDISRKFGAV